MSAAARQSERRGFVLVAAIVVIGCALFVATALIHTVERDAAVASRAAAREQARALARSGLLVIMDELDRQRDVILNGDRPILEAEYVVFDEFAAPGVIRLLPLGPAGERLLPEAAKLDMHEVDAAALERTGLVDRATADSIVAFRDSLGRPMQSIAELLAVEGVTPELLYGPLDRLLYQAISGAATYEGTIARGLDDVITVFAFEPSLQQSGRLRINLNVEWSAELEQRIERRFDVEVAAGVKAIFESGYTFDDDAKIFQLLNRLGVPPAEWVTPIDAFTAKDEQFAFGRLDINTAAYEALCALPTITPEQAASIVERRDELDADERATIAWPALLGLVEPKQYDEIGGLITTRSWTWRVRLAAGAVSPDDPEGSLLDETVYDVVFDLSAPRPRIAYLRDVSLWETALTIALHAPEPEDADESEAVDALDSDGPMTADAGGLPSGDAIGAGEDAKPDDEGRAPLGGRGDPGDDDGDASGSDVAPTDGSRRVGRWTRGG
jgi:DNA uptake protein ComE-like DNA-binding protein